MATKDKTTQESNGIKRYNLTIPETLYQEIERVADKRQTTVVDILRRFIKLGLLAVQAEESIDGALIIRQGDTEREIILI